MSQDEANTVVELSTHRAMANTPTPQETFPQVPLEQTMRVVRLVSGEDIIGQVFRIQDSTDYYVVNPFTFGTHTDYHVGQPTMIAMNSYIPYAVGNTIMINEKDMVALYKPVPQVIEIYKKYLVVQKEFVSDMNVDILNTLNAMLDEVIVEILKNKKEAADLKKDETTKEFEAKETEVAKTNVVNFIKPPKDTVN